MTVSHSSFLIAMSCIVALVAGFTGLSLTRDLARKPIFERKLSIALAAVALGGGIWSMHFVAMLGLKLPILFYYDAAITLISALSAILLVGAALILLHFTPRSPLSISLAGGIVGLGVLVMHYVGMAGLEMCRAVYTLPGVVFSSAVAFALCILAFRITYGERSNRNILLGTLCFAIAVVSVHFLAIAGTRFVPAPAITDFGPAISNETLALAVIFFSFVIFGACLWVSVTYLVAPATASGAATAVTIASPAAAQAVAVAQAVAQDTDHLQIPCERDGRKVFVRARDVLFVRADGHYTQVYTATERLFCAWPITAASKRLLPAGFLQTHRSYLVNPARVTRFERDKGKGRCLFDGAHLPPAPVSRAKLKDIQDALAALPGAVRA